MTYHVFAFLCSLSQPILPNYLFLELDAAFPMLEGQGDIVLAGLTTETAILANSFLEQ